jgi:hypothetical protein
MKKAVEKLKPIYSKDYYRMEKLVHDPNFKKRVREMLNWYAQIGAPVPSKPMEYSGYLEWLNKFWDAYTKLDMGEVANKQKQIQENTAIPNEEKYWVIMEMRDKTLPPTPGKFLEDLLEQFGHDPKNQKFDDFLEAYIFRGKKHLSESLFTIIWKRNTKSDKMELFIQLEPHTRKEHIEAFWDQIEDDLKHLPGHLGKSKEWKTLDRDLEVFNEYEALKKSIPKGSKLHSNKHGGNRHPLDIQVWQKLYGKYPELTLSMVRKAVTRVAALNEAENTFKDPT